MKRVISILSLFFVIIASINAFDIYNSDDKEVNYFSINAPQVYIKTDQNLTHFEVKYSISNLNYSNIIDLEVCENLYCGDFSLLNLINNANGSFAGATKFEILVNGNSNFVYLDFDKPIIELNNYIINSTKKNIELEFTYSDNSNKIDKVELYKTENSDLIFITDITNKTNYNYTLETEGNLTLLFKITDIAQNYNEVEYDFEILDFFEPIIIESFVILNSNSYELNFHVEDKELDRYEVKQNDLKFSGELSGSSMEKSIILPFDDGTVIFYVFDKQGNYLTKEIDLDTRIKNTYSSIYSNEKIFKFTSDANSCILQKINTKTKNEEFSKSSSTFSTNLDISSSDIYSLNFYCEKTGFRQYFTREFSYDIEKPTESIINVTKESDGSLKLTWTKSIDEQTDDVSYELYRDSKEIYSGSRTKYSDYGISYPNEYKYYVIAIDEAGNEVKSDKIEETPQKIKIEYTTSLKTNNIIKSDTLNIEIDTEKNSIVTIIIKNNGQIISEKIIDNVQLKITENLKFNVGSNQVIIEVVDEFGNIKTDTYFVTYEEPILIQETIEEEKPTIKQTEVLENSTLINNTTKESAFSFLWILVIILLLGFSIYGFYLYYLDDNKKSSKPSYNKKPKINKISFNKSKKKDFFTAKRKNDFGLEKSLSKVKQKRINRQKELIEEKKRDENKTPKIFSEFEKTKFSDISKSSNMSFVNFGESKKKQRIKKTKSSIENIVDISEKSESLLNMRKTSINKKQKKISKMNFSNLFKQKEKPKSDEFSNYINRIKSQKSWTNTNDYLQSTYDKKQQIETEKLKKKQEEESLKLKELNKKDEEKLLKEEKKLKKQEAKREFDENRIIAKTSLDDYLNKRKKKSRFFFAEREVERDLRSRK